MSAGPLGSLGPLGQEALFLEAAFEIGARLCRDAIWDGGQCNWLGDAMEPHFGEWRVVHRSFGPDLYSGTAGIALFLGRLARFADEPLLLDTARGALRQAWERRQGLPPEIRHGLYTGWLGLAYCLAELAEPLGEPALEDAARGLAEEIRGRPLPPFSFDVLSGAAGAIQGLLALNRRAPRDFLLEEAARLAGELCRAARRHGDCWSWTTLEPAGGLPQRDLTGYSHGTAGIALALLELHALTGEQTWREAAELALAYERRCFDRSQANWPDFRGGDPAPGAAPVCGLAWCHGAPGIGLARLRGFALTGDERQRAEAEAAIGTTYAALAAPAAAEGFSLCHGLAGNAELFLLAAEVLGEPWYRQVAAEVGRRGIERYGRPRRPWPCGVNGGGETPGLMLGRAGIGHFFLRLHHPAAVPSPLLIAGSG